MKNLFVIGSVIILIITSCQNQSEKKASPPAKIATTESKTDTTIVNAPPSNTESRVDDARDAAIIHTMSTTDKPEIMVKNFYAWYTDHINRKSNPIEKKILNAYLSSALVKSLAAEKEIDEDYFLKAQDVGEDWAETITIQQVTNTPNKVSLTVKMGAQNLKKTLLVDLVKNKNAWVIDKVSASK